MKGLFLNLPNEQKIMRRYMCSYNSPTFLFQPIELISLAAILRDWKNGTPDLIDAIADNVTTKAVSKHIATSQYDFIISLTGFECFGEDIQVVDELKTAHPEVPIILFGHYATQFPQEILAKSKADFILHGEPDLVFSEWLDAFYGDKNYDNIQGLSFKASGNIVHQPGNGRIPKPNQLPMPAYDLLNNNAYGEPFFPKPYGLIQSARGCPYSCNYCVRSFGSKLTALSPENILLHVEKYIELFGIKSFRFIDDTFTATPKRVVEFCKLLINSGHDLEWSCLSRADTLNKEMLRWMKKSGCSRIYIGAESGSEKVLTYYNKGIDLEKSRENLKYCKELGFELMGFFMVGAPGETIEDVEKSIAFAKTAKFDFVTIGELKAYPGTALFDKIQDDVDFSILPYKNEFKAIEVRENAIAFEKLFFKRFYFSLGTIFNLIGRIARKPIRTLSALFENAYKFIYFLLFPSAEKKRKDFI